MPQQPATEESVLKTLPLLLIALLIGVLSFTVVAFTIAPAAGASPPPATPGGFNLQTMRLIMGILGLMAIAGYFVSGQVTRANARRALKSTNADRESARASAAAAFMTATIMRAAPAEALGLFGAVLLFLTGDRLALVGVAVCVVLIASLLPVRSRFDSFWRSVSGAPFGT